MGWYAVEAVEEAIEDSKELLFPFSITTWAKLGLIALIAGGGGLNFPNFPSSSPGSYSGSDFSDTSSTDVGNYAEIPENPATAAFTAGTSPNMSMIAALVGILAGLLLGLMLLSSIFTFIYYSSLIDKEVFIIQKFRENLSNGSRYFVFRFLIGLGALITLITVAFIASKQPIILVPLILLGIPFFIIFSAVMMLIHDFVLLEMLEENQKLLESIRSMFEIFREEWKQAAMYVLIKTVIGIVIGIGSLIGLLVVLLILIIPFGILGALFYSASKIATAIIAVIGILAFLIVFTIFVTAPLKTFVYYYAINVYREFKT